MIEIELPWPDPALSQNARVHWAVRARHTKAARHLAAQELMAVPRQHKIELLQRGPAIRVHLTFSPPDRRRRDLNNLEGSCKAYIDGIQDALQVDDTHFVITRSRQTIPGLRGVKIRLEGAQ